MDVRQGKNRILKGAGGVLLALFFLLLFPMVLAPQNASAYDEVNDIKITVGYWGGKDYTKKEVSLGQLAASCGTSKRIYTWINAGNAPGVTEAEGIMLSDIMSYSGIDMNSVYYFNFYSVDAATYANSNQQWTLDQLFGERVTYENAFRRVLKDYEKDRDDFVANPESHFTVEDVFDFSEMKYTDNAWNEAESIQPMLALRTASSTWKSYIPQSQLDYSGLADTGKPILMFGQAGRNDITRNLMAQMVNKIHVWFEGSPDISFGEKSFDSEVGSEKKIGVNVSTPDEFLSEKIAQQVTFKTSNRDVATVDDDGTVRIKGEGNAEITAVYEGKEYGKIVATGIGKSDKKKDEGSGSGGSGEGSGSGGSGSGDGNGEGSGSGDSGSGDGNGNGKGSGSGDSGNSGSGKGSGSGNRGSGSKTSKNISLIKNNNDSGNNKSNDSTRGGITAAAGNNSGSKAGGGTSGSKGTSETKEAKKKLYEIAKASTKLAEDPDAAYMIKWIVLLALATFAAGIIKQSVYYRGQVNWIGKAKRAYEKT